MDNRQLQNTIGTHVVELEFTRRHPKLGWSDIRGLFGTTNLALLNSDFGFQVLHFQPPKGVGMGYDYRTKGLCVAWDIFRQEYRVFGAEQISWHRKWSLTNDEEIAEFKQYFYDYIINLSEDNKLKFMGYVGMSAQPVTLQPKGKWSGIWTAIQNKYQQLKKRVSDWKNKNFRK